MIMKAGSDGNVHYSPGVNCGQCKECGLGPGPGPWQGLLHRENNSQ